MITITLSETNARRFAEREAEIQKLTASKNADVTALLAQQCEPDEFIRILSEKWRVEVSDTAITVVPPDTPE